MHRTWIVSGVLCLLLGACEDGSSDVSTPLPDASDGTDPTPDASDGTDPPAAELSCDWESAQLVPASPPELPSGQEGALEEALIGSWQHTFIVHSDDSVEANEEGTDIRYVFGPQKLAFCQHIEGAYGPDSNVTTYTLEGDVIDVGTTYTGIAWNSDILVLNNDALGDQQYVLQRR